MHSQSFHAGTNPAEPALRFVGIEAGLNVVLESPAVRKNKTRR
jgi:hypothetical protein